MSMPTAADLGAELTRFVQGPVDSPSARAFIQDTVTRMLATPGRSVVDALAFVALSETLTRMVVDRLSEEADDEALYISALAGALQQQAISTLEALTGMAGDAFAMTARHLN